MGRKSSIKISAAEEMCFNQALNDSFDTSGIKRFYHIPN